MSDELQSPPVIDLEALLRPVSEESPSGDSLRYSGIYDEIAEARRADDNLSQGDWKTELKVADFRSVITLAEPALTSQSKDLQVAVWLSEALIRINGFAGLRDSLKLVAGLQDTFWETLHPAIDEGDMEGRANAVAWLDTQGAAATATCPITAGQGYGFLDWQDAKRFDFPANVDSLDADSQAKYAELRTQADTEGRVTAEMWKSAVAQTRRAFCEQVNYTIGECWEAFAELNRVIEERYESKQMPGLSGLKKSLEDVHGQVKKLLERKRLEEPNETDIEETTEANGEVYSIGETNEGGGGTSGGPVKSRPDALKRLAEIAAFFQRTEPHSPVAYLVQRAVKWGNMPLDSWLQEVIKDPATLDQLNEMLGIKLSSSSGSDDYYESTTDESTESTDSTESAASNEW